MNKLVFILLAAGASSLGNSCAQVIQEHYFDLSKLQSPNDYQLVYEKGNEKMELFFNFCKYLVHSCTEQPSYYFVMTKDEQSCNYFRESPDQQYKLVTTEMIPIGLKITYENVNENGQIIEFMLICNRTKDLFLYPPNKLGEKLVVTLESKNICPQEINFLLYEFIGKFKWIFFFFGVAIGPMELLVGEKIFGITVFVMSFIFSFLVLLIVAVTLFVRYDSSSLWIGFLLTIILCCSLATGYLVSKLRRLGIIICGATAGLFVCILLNQLFLWRVNSQPSYLFYYNSLAIFILIGAITAYEFENQIVIVATSLIGSYITVRTYSIIFGGFPNELSLNQNIFNHLGEISIAAYVYCVLIIGLFALGVVF